jgi:hypothetical protein
MNFGILNEFLEFILKRKSGKEKQVHSTGSHSAHGLRPRSRRGLIRPAALDARVCTTHVVTADLAVAIGDNQCLKNRRRLKNRLPPIPPVFGKIGRIR